MIDKAFLEILACPVCKAALLSVPAAKEGTGGELLECTGCRRTYDIQDGIPVMLIERETNAP